MKHALLAALALLGTGVSVSADTIKVPDQHATIQAAIDAANLPNTIASEMYVLNNVVKKSDRYGIEADNGANTFSGNVATGSGQCDLYDHESENQTTNIYNGNSFAETCYGT